MGPTSPRKSGGLAGGGGPLASLEVGPEGRGATPARLSPCPQKVRAPNVRLEPPSQAGVSVLGGSGDERMAGVVREGLVPDIWSRGWGPHRLG